MKNLFILILVLLQAILKSKSTLYIFCFTILLSSSCFSQTAKEYFDEDWNKTTEQNAKYYRIGTKDYDGNWNGPFKDFYINGKLQNEGTFVKGLQDGIFIYYYPDEKLRLSGEYIKSSPVGKWQSWYKNGQLKEEFFYVDPDDKNTLTPNERIRHNNMYDSLGKQLVKEGTGEYHSFYDNNVLETKGQLKNYLREGEWVGYHDDGTLYFKEKYEEGKLISGESWDKDGKSYHYTQLEKMPEMPGGVTGYYKFIGRNLRYPKAAQKAGVQGKVYLSFVVDKDGAITNVEVLKGIGLGCEEEAIRVLLLGKNWTPGVQRGQNVKVLISGCDAKAFNS